MSWRQPAITATQNRAARNWMTIATAEDAGKRKALTRRSRWNRRARFININDRVLSTQSVSTLLEQLAETSKGVKGGRLMRNRAHLARAERFEETACLLQVE